MFGNFTEEARKILVMAKKEMQSLKHPYVGSEHLVLAILKSENDISEKLKEYDLNYNKMRDEIINVIGIGKKTSSWFLYTPLLKRVIENAIVDSKENNNGEVTIDHLFSSLLEEGEGVAIRIMLGMDIDIDELYSEFVIQLSNPKKKKSKKKLLLEELGIDLTKKAEEGKLDPVIGREDEVRRILEVLSRRTKNNPILIGEAGVGKTAIVEELSRRIVNGDVPLSLRNKRIISLDMATAVAGTKYRGEFEDRIRKILKEIEENDEIILFIDEIHTLVGAGGAEGAIDASNIFKPALARNKLRCIGATTIMEYKKYIEKDGALDRRFQKVLIEEPSKEILKDILLKLKNIYEKYHFVTINDDMLDLMIELSEKYVYDRNQPDKAIDILDEVCARVSLKENKNIKKYNKLKQELTNLIKQKKDYILKNDFNKAAICKEKENQIMDQINNIEMKINTHSKKEVTKEDIAEVVHLKTKIPVYEILNDNVKIIKALEKNLKSKIIGQDEAISQLIHIAKKIKLGFNDSRCYSMMFMGPSGVGKTELSQIFGKNMTSGNVIKLDMSEFSESHSISKIVGAPPGYVGYDDNRNILEEIRNKPYSVLILDEIEKAHPSIINLLFQILDDSKVKDSNGNIIRFDHVIILMTSNIGFDDINIGFNKKERQVIMSKLKENFSVPFVNRIDNIITFNHLTKENITTLIQNKIKKVTLKYQKRNIKIKIDPKVVKEILELSNYHEFGARKLDKIIKDKVENVIIDEMIEGKNSIHIQTLKENVKV